MKFAQLSLDDQLEQLIVEEESKNPLNFSYLDDELLGEDSFIRAKLDWFTLIIEDHSINEVISWIGLDEKFRDEFFKKQMSRSYSFDDTFVFIYNGVCIQVSKFYLYNLEFDISVFDKKLPKIRLDITGKGLDYLRSEHVDVDELFRDPTYLLSGSHLTRADFAFDFINYKSDIISQLVEYCMTQHTASDRILIQGLTAALTYSLKLGQEQSVYIGAPKSDQLLRCYNKKLQYIDLEQGVYVKHNPYNNPDSWIRIELQMRNAKGHKLNFGGSDFGGILNYIIDYYKFADLTTPAHRRELWQIWQDFVDRDKLPPIIQNLQYVEKVRTTKEKALAAFDFSVRTSTLRTTITGILDEVIKINKWLIKMQKSNDPISEKRWKSFINSCNQCDIHISTDRSRDGLYLNQEHNLVLYGYASQTLYELQNLEEYVINSIKNDYVRSIKN